MGIINSEGRKIMESEIRERLAYTIGSEYADKILNYETVDIKSRTVIDEIIEDICLSPDYEKYGGYTCADLQFAIGRVICHHIGTDY